MIKENYPEKNEEINSSNLQEINQILEEGDQISSEMDEKSLILCLKSLQEKLKLNSTLRMKFASDPEKYIDSEVDLHEEIKILQRIAAYPNLIPLFIDQEGVQILINLLSHPNLDIINDAVIVIEEVTDSDFLQDLPEAKEFLEFFISENLFDLLVSNLFKVADSKHDTVSEENQQFVSDILSVLENFIVVYSYSGKLLTEKTKILPWLINRITQTGSIDNIKLFCSEILHSLCLESSLAISTVIPHLLKILLENSHQRGGTEEEFLQNIVNVICSLLLSEESQEIFLNSDGIGITLSLMKENTLLRHLAVKIIDFAIQNSKKNCKVLIESDGLSPLFSYFMGKGFKSKASIQSLVEANDEHCTNIIASLIKFSHGVNLDRLIYKFKERDGEKAERLFELFRKYQKKVVREELEGDATASKFIIQTLSLIIAFLYVNSVNREKIERLCNLHNVNSDEIKQNLVEMNTHLGEESFDNEGSESFSIKFFVESLIKKLSN